MSVKLIIFGLMAQFVKGFAQTCCDSAELRGDFWSFKYQGKDCALNINFFDGLKLSTALEYIDCKVFGTLIINGQHMTQPFLASEEDMTAIPEHTNVIYENIQSAQIEKEETGSNLKSLNLVGSEDFKFHPSLLDEAEFIEFDGVKLQYNSDERIFKLSQTEHKHSSSPRAESLIASGQSKGFAPSDFEILLMVICGIQLLVISMIVVVSCSSKGNKAGLFHRSATSSSLSSDYTYSCASSEYSAASRKPSTISGVSQNELQQQPEECAIMIDATQKS